MSVNWARVFNRLFEIINSDGDANFSGGRFISKVREVDPYFAHYTRYIAERRACGESTSRKDYFYDILMSFEEANRLRLLNAILDGVRHLFPDETAAIQDELGGISAVPPVRVDPDAWNAERLNAYLGDMDVRIGSGKLLIDQHGEDAPIFAAMRADELFAADDLDGSRVWKRVLRAIKLLAEERTEETLH